MSDVPSVYTVASYHTRTRFPVSFVCVLALALHVFHAPAMAWGAFMVAVLGIAVYVIGARLREVPVRLDGLLKQQHATERIIADMLQGASESMQAYRKREATAALAREAAAPAVVAPPARAPERVPTPAASGPTVAPLAWRTQKQ